MSKQEILEKLKELQEEKDINRILTETPAGVGYLMAMKAIETDFDKNEVSITALEGLMHLLVDSISKQQEKDSRADTPES